MITPIRSPLADSTQGWTLLGWFAACLCSFAASSVSGEVLVNSLGFEAPAFVDGLDLEGQQSWVVAGGGADHGCGPAGGRRVGHAGSSPRPRSQFQPVFGPIWSLRRPWGVSFRSTGICVSNRRPLQAALAPFFGVNVFDDSGGAIGQLAGFGVDASTGDVLFQAEDSGVLVETETFVNFGEWDHYRIELDFANDTYSAFFNGVELVPDEGFIDGFLGIDRLTDADIVAFAAAGDSVSQQLTGVAYVDNYLVRDGLRADFNSDGSVDEADYAAWRKPTRPNRPRRPWRRQR